MMCKTFVLPVLMLPLFIITAASAQNVSSDKIKPQWLHKQPEPTNASFRYEIISSTASSLDAARKQCLAELISSSGLTHGVIVTSDYRSTEKMSQVWNDGKLTEQIEIGSENEYHAKSDETKLFVETIDEYWTRDNSGTFYLNKLYAKSELGIAPLFDNVELTTKYGAHGLWRSAIVPGWGQFHKGSNLKGGLILGGTAALVAGIVFTESQRSDYVRKISKTHDAGIKRAYSTKRDHFATARNICVGAAAVLYVYNLIDAVVAPGARRVLVRQRANGNTYAVLPTLSTNGIPAMMAAITF
ncbi:MAG: hypothetical protein J1E79_03680 [Rikenella sp.]|nr:hypothetical protein [Rikenella sp.]